MHRIRLLAVLVAAASAGWWAGQSGTIVPSHRSGDAAPAPSPGPAPETAVRSGPPIAPPARPASYDPARTVARLRASALPLDERAEFEARIAAARDNPALQRIVIDEVRAALGD